jgi:hypothetical protein
MFSGSLARSLVLDCGADCGTLPAPRYIYSGFAFVPEEAKHMEKQSYCRAGISHDSKSWHRFRVTFFCRPDMSRAAPDGHRP